jgi:hypothetical protein
MQISMAASPPPDTQATLVVRCGDRGPCACSAPRCSGRARSLANLNQRSCVSRTPGLWAADSPNRPRPSWRTHPNPAGVTARLLRRFDSAGDQQLGTPWTLQPAGRSRRRASKARRAPSSLQKLMLMHARAGHSRPRRAVAAAGRPEQAAQAPPPDTAGPDSQQLAWHGDHGAGSCGISCLASGSKDAGLQDRAQAAIQQWLHGCGTSGPWAWRRRALPPPPPPQRTAAATSALERQPRQQPPIDQGGRGRRGALDALRRGPAPPQARRRGGGVWAGGRRQEQHPGHRGDLG